MKLTATPGDSSAKTQPEVILASSERQDQKETLIIVRDVLQARSRLHLKAGRTSPSVWGSSWVQPCVGV